MDTWDDLSREELIQLVRALHARVVELEAEIARLRGGPPAGKPKREPPAFVKANRPPNPQRERKHRGRGFSRRRETPTGVVDHLPDRCSHCGRKLHGGWVHDVRQVIDLPQACVQVTEHRMLRCRCGACGHMELARPDLSKEVVGQHRVGARLMSFIAYLRTFCRLPIRTIQRLLSGRYALHLSEGEIVHILQTVAARGQAAYEGLLAEVRGSPVVHADETGWREDGVNGYLWSFSTPTACYYVRTKSRSGQVARDALGEAFEQALVSDFYAGYNWYQGPHQYCWVHLSRDLHKLQEDHPDNTCVEAWVQAIRVVFDEARAWSHTSVFARRKQRRVYAQRVRDLARAYRGTSLPQHTLAERIHKHALNLFLFVERPDVPADNNAAERAVRPCVVIRKISGGTRSPKGSQTLSVLMSLFGTWHVRQQDLLQSCFDMLTAPPTTTSA